MNVWMRGRSASATAFAADSISAKMRARESRDHRALDLPRDALHGLEVAGRGDREASLDHVDAETRELLGDLELLGRVQRDAGRLLAVAQRRVEDQYSVSVSLSMMSSFLSGFSCGFFSDSVCGNAAATRYSPRGGRRRSRREAGNIIGAELSGTPPRAPCASYCRMLTARARTIPIVTSEASDCTSIAIFAIGLSGIVSVGLNADGVGERRVQVVDVGCPPVHSTEVALGHLRKEEVGRSSLPRAACERAAAVELPVPDARTAARW